MKVSIPSVRPTARAVLLGLGMLGASAGHACILSYTITAPEAASVAPGHAFAINVVVANTGPSSCQSFDLSLNRTEGDPSTGRPERIERTRAIAALSRGQTSALSWTDTVPHNGAFTYTLQAQGSLLQPVKFDSAARTVGPALTLVVLDG